MLRVLPLRRILVQLVRSFPQSLYRSNGDGIRET